LESLNIEKLEVEFVRGVTYEAGGWKANEAPPLIRNGMGYELIWKADKQ
jgi:hypothetical protein